MRKLLLVLVLAGAGILVATETSFFPTLGSMAPVGRQADEFYLLSTSQLLRPWGHQTLISGRPVDLTFDSKKRVVAVLNSHSILFMDGSTGVQVAEVKCHSTSYMGIAFRP